MKNVLSPTRKKILEYLNKETANNRFPSVREICNATGLKSTSTVHSHLKVLEQNGYISRLAGHRSIRMTGAATSVSVPVVGRVTAGLPVYAFEDVTGHIPFPAEKASGKDLFALNVTGESMKDIGIYDGDIVVCEKTSCADDGDIVVALIGEEATVKSFYRENGRYRLQPHNPDFEPIITDELIILGRVISLYREY